MPTKTTKQADTEASAKAEVKEPKADLQGHAVGGVDFVPSEKEYDPGKHANHSHFNP